MQAQTAWVGQREGDILASLPAAVRRYCFTAADEAIGVRLEDYWHLLDLCGSAGWAVSGWKIAVIHHRQVTATNSLIPQADSLAAAIPLQDGSSRQFGGNVEYDLDLFWPDAVRESLAQADGEIYGDFLRDHYAQVLPQFKPYIRLFFSIEKQDSFIPS